MGLPQSIGQRLRVQEAAREDEAQKEARRRAEAELAKSNAEREEVCKFFQSVRDEVEAAVAQNRPVKFLRMPSGAPFEVGRLIPSDPAHPHYLGHVEFSTWGQKNQLKLVFKRDHDTGGMQSWQLVRYEPA